MTCNRVSLTNFKNDQIICELISIQVLTLKKDILHVFDVSVLEARVRCHLVVFFELQQQNEADFAGIIDANMI